MSDKEFGGLHIDSDWKTEAAREKERLAQQEQTARAEGGDPVNATMFMELINLLAMQAAIALGGYQAPGGERIAPNHPAAKHHIDMLDVLEQKTRGRLTEEEKRMLDSVIYELRVHYVQMVGGAAPMSPPPLRQA